MFDKFKKSLLLALRFLYIGFQETGFWMSTNCRVFFPIFAGIKMSEYIVKKDNNSGNTAACNNGRIIIFLAENGK